VLVAATMGTRFCRSLAGGGKAPGSPASALPSPLKSDVAAWQAALDANDWNGINAYGKRIGGDCARLGVPGVSVA
jgi:hypothetical protein